MAHAGLAFCLLVVPRAKGIHNNPCAPFSSIWQKHPVVPVQRLLLLLLILHLNLPKVFQSKSFF